MTEKLKKSSPVVEILTSCRYGNEFTHPQQARPTGAPKTQQETPKTKALTIDTKSAETRKVQVQRLSIRDVTYRASGLTICTSSSWLGRKHSTLPGSQNQDRAAFVRAAKIPQRSFSLRVRVEHAEAGVPLDH